MSLKLGNTDLSKVMLGNQEVSAIYKGSDEVWTSAPPNNYGTEHLSGSRDCYFEFQKAGVTFPTDKFTVETWFKSFGGANHGVYASLFGAWSHPNNNGWMFGYNMSGQSGAHELGVMHKMYDQTYVYGSVPGYHDLQGWNHVAFIKNGSQIDIYINGARVYRFSASSYTWGGHTQFYCGGSGIRASAYGTFSNFRISNIVRYTDHFTAPSSYFEPDANTLVLAHCGAELKDYSGNNIPMQAASGAKVTTDSPWSARDTYSKLANAQIAVREAATKIKEIKDDS